MLFKCLYVWPFGPIVSRTKYYGIRDPIREVIFAALSTWNDLQKQLKLEERTSSDTCKRTSKTSEEGYSEEG